MLLCLRGGGLGFQRDDQVNGEPCDNISAKNGSYCELTAMYWAWKNIKKLYPNLEYIGLNHYRRFFSFDEKEPFSCPIYKPLCELKNYKINTKKLFAILEKGFDIVTHHPIVPYPIWISHSTFIIHGDFLVLRQVIHDLYPEYDEAFYHIIVRGNKVSPLNMFIMNWKDFEAYCTWLFDILFEVEKRVDVSGYRGNQRRMFGYMSEIILSVWLYKNNIKTKELNVYRYGDDVGKQNRIKLFLKFLRSFVTARLIRSPYKKIHDWSWINK